jgi:hypothetical protein
MGLHRTVHLPVAKKLNNFTSQSAITQPYNDYEEYFDHSEQQVIG